MKRRKGQKNPGTKSVPSNIVKFLFNKKNLVSLFSMKIPPEEYQHQDEEANKDSAKTDTEKDDEEPKDKNGDDDEDKDNNGDAPAHPKILAPAADDVDGGAASRPPRKYRLESVHVAGLARGTGAEKVYEYFKEFSPVSFAWVDGGSANVIWALPASAARALICLSRPLLEREEEAMEVNERVAGEDGEDEKKEAKILTKEEIEARVRRNKC